MSNELDKEVVATGGDTAQNTGSDQNQDLGATNSAPTSPTNKIGLFNAMNSTFPLANTTRAMLNGGIIVTPPNPSGGDRTREDRDRHKDRIRDQIKPQLQPASRNTATRHFKVLLHFCTFHACAHNILSRQPHLIPSQQLCDVPVRVVVVANGGRQKPILGLINPI